MRKNLRPVLLALALGIAFVLSQQFIYRPWVVPQLATWQSVPMYVWCIVFMPEVAVCIGAIYWLRTAISLTIFCILGALVISSCQFASGLLNQPAHHKAIEGGLLQVSVQFIVIALLLAIVIGVCTVVRLGVIHARAG